MTPLRQRMLEDMGIRNLAENTQSAYLLQITAYAKYFKRPPEELGPEEVRAYQVYLTQTRNLSPSSLSVAAGALRFLYKVTLKRDWAFEQIPMPKRPFTLPVILSIEEVMHFLSSIDNIKHRAILTTAYAAGLRVSEATCRSGFILRSTRATSAENVWSFNKSTTSVHKPSSSVIFLLIVLTSISNAMASRCALTPRSTARRSM